MQRHRVKLKKKVIKSFFGSRNIYTRARYRSCVKYQIKWPRVYLFKWPGIKLGLRSGGGGGGEAFAAASEKARSER